MLNQKNYTDMINLQDEVENEKDCNEDLIIIKLTSVQVTINFSQLCKYSQLIREDYILKDAREKLSPVILKYQEEYDIKESNIILFFNLIKEENSKIDSLDYLDIYTLSTLFKVNILIQVIQKCIKNHSNDISFIIDLILKQNSIKNDQIKSMFNNIEISVFSELNLIDKINECLQNEDFAKLPISIVYRIFESRGENEFSNDLLLDFIKKSIEKRFVLFNFLDIQKLSENKLIELKEIRESKPSFYFNYLRVDFNYLMHLKEKEKNQKKQLDSLLNENQKIKTTNGTLQSKIQQLETTNGTLQSKVQQLETTNGTLQSKVQQLETKIAQLTSEIENSNKIIKVMKEGAHLADLPYKENFKGIINYLNSNGNILNEINITSSSINNNRPPQNVILFNDTSKQFCTDDSKGSWLRFDFKSYRIMVTGYTLRSNKWGEKAGGYLTGWVIEGSNDNVNYETLDEQKSTSSIKGPLFTKTFTINNANNKKKFKYIQVRETENASSYHHLGLNAIEFYGSLFLVQNNL